MTFEMPPLDEITRRIVERFNPTRIVVFGSHARSNEGADSDLDLFIEMESDLPVTARRAAISSLFWPRTWPLDVIVYTPDEVAKVREGKSTLLAAIEAEGRVLYERP